MVDGPAASPFVMHGARAAIAGGMIHIEEQVKSIEIAVDDNPGLAFDLAKTLIESTCRTILTERRISFDTNEDLPGLFRTATTHLPLLPATASRETDARRSLAQTLNGLSTALHGVADLRNAYGFASHGREGSRPIMEGAQALLAAEAADAIVGFLHRVHQQERTTSSETRLEYADNETFNEYVDEAHEPILIFGLEYRPSEVLFNVDREVYRSALAEYKAELESNSHTDDDTQDDGETP